MATVRDKIFLRMKELDVKQTELSEKVGIKTQTLSYLEESARFHSMCLRKYVWCWA